MNEFDDIEMLDFMFDAILLIRKWVKDNFMELIYVWAMVMFQILLAIVIAL